MGNFELATTKEFDGVDFNCYIENDNSKDFWATREQIGELLGYKNPRKAIKDIHNRNQERLDKFSKTVELRNMFNGAQVAPPFRNEPVTTVYSFRGLLEICRYSNQPKADAVMDFLYDIADEIRRTGSYSTKNSKQKTDITRAIATAKEIYLSSGMKVGKRLGAALDKIFEQYAGFSALEIAGIHREDFEEPETVRNLPAWKQRIIDVLKTQDTITPKELSKRCNLLISTSQGHLRRLEKEGILKRIAYGVYSLNDNF